MYGRRSRLERELRPRGRFAIINPAEPDTSARRETLMHRSRSPHGFANSSVGVDVFISDRQWRLQGPLNGVETALVLFLSKLGDNHLALMYSRVRHGGRCMLFCTKDSFPASDISFRICSSLDAVPTKMVGSVFRAALYCWVGLAIWNCAWKSMSTMRRSGWSPLNTTSMYSYSPGIHNHGMNRQSSITKPIFLIFNFLPQQKRLAKSIPRPLTLKLFLSRWSL